MSSMVYSGLVQKQTGSIPLEIELTQKGRVTKVNHLKQVSPSIKPGVAVSESKTTTSSSKSKGLDVMWLFCFLPAGILYLIFKQTDPKRRK